MEDLPPFTPEQLAEFETLFVSPRTPPTTHHRDVGSDRMSATSREAAAAARAQHVRQRGDQPSQRRCAELTGSRAVARVPASMELCEQGDGGPLEFLGYATVYEREPQLAQDLAGQ
ncbi:hypothetical protein [Nonomuraea sp. PA05]|uniref:hypothetical protein n=1 Tax=Nonomuraea sp. PA05 TaxID=2604466 RepID=UPI001CA35CC0|nr:hypothetical protein [Nonomuraea sp. PA05]